MRSILTSAALERTLSKVLDGSLEGSFLVRAAEDFAESKATSVTVLSNIRPVVNSRRVLAVDGEAIMS